MISPFKSFFMGGFECADHLNRQGVRVNILKETKHDLFVDEDYRLLKEIGINVVREGICWSEVEKKNGAFDFSEILKRINAAKKYEVQQIWDLIHFGYPDDLYPTHPQFCNRFEKLCIEFAKFYQLHSDDALMVIPINEISFLSWFSGEVRGTTPYAIHSGWDMKYHLCRAAIVGIKALKSVEPNCRIVMAEPLVKIHGDGVTPEQDVKKVDDYQFQAMDIISGRMCPELGGDESFLDILGFNYYWNCQWILNGDTLPWPESESVRTPLSVLLTNVYEKYKRPIFLAETGHFGIGRIPWIEEVVGECMKVIKQNVPFMGICVYPITDRPDWDDLTRYSNCGIFDLDTNGIRIPYVKYIETIIRFNSLMSQVMISQTKSLTLV